MKINVTERDIRNGVRDDAGQCPVALAVGRRVKSDVGVRAEWFGLWLYGSGERYYPCDVPESVTDFIERFDGGLPVQPFSFEMDIPVKYVK